MVDVAAGVVAHGGLLVVGQGLEVGEHVLDGLVGQRRALERSVRVVHVRLVVLVVVDAHRLLVDVRLERAVVIGKRRDLERHLRSFLDVCSRGYRVCSCPRWPPLRSTTRRSPRGRWSPGCWSSTASPARLSRPTTSSTRATSTSATRSWASSRSWTSRARTRSTRRCAR